MDLRHAATGYIGGTRVKKIAIIVVTAAAALVLVGSALAQSGDQPYAGKAAGVQATVVKTKTAGATASNGGTLPFTGLDLTLIVAGGVALLVAGVALRRAGRNRA